MPPPTDPIAYPPHMRAVPFPTAAAEAAVTVCDRIASRLESDLGTRAALVRDATVDWEGRYRTEFDGTSRTQTYRLDAEKTSLRRFVSQLRAAIDEAAALNAARAEMRAEHRAAAPLTPVAGPH